MIQRRQRLLKKNKEPPKTDQSYTAAVEDGELLRNLGNELKVIKMTQSIHKCYVARHFSHGVVSCPKRVRHACHVYFEEFCTRRVHFNVAVSVQYSLNIVMIHELEIIYLGKKKK